MENEVNNLLGLHLQTACWKFSWIIWQACWSHLLSKECQPTHCVLLSSNLLIFSKVSKIRFSSLGKMTDRTSPFTVTFPKRLASKMAPRVGNAMLTTWEAEGNFRSSSLLISTLPATSVLVSLTLIEKVKFFPLFSPDTVVPIVWMKTSDMSMECLCTSSFLAKELTECSRTQLLFFSGMKVQFEMLLLLRMWLAMML